MKNTLFYLVPAGLLIAGSVAYFSLDLQHSHAAAPDAPKTELLLAAPGRVEPVSEEIEVTPEVSGRLVEVRVEEGDRVHKGQALAGIERVEYQARVASAEASLRQKQAEVNRLLDGARPQERAQARAAVEAAQAVMDNARNEMERRRALLQLGAVSQDEFGRSERDFQVARARYDEAIQQNDLVLAGAREEDRSRARAEVQAAEAHLEEARAFLEKTVIRSPIDGVVTRRHSSRGESVNSQTPLFTISDDSVLRVRAEVDEVDVARLSAGQSAFVKAAAFGDRTFEGRIVRIGRVLGRKNIRTDEPKERMDNKILEVLIELQDGHELPLGLRVDTFIRQNAAQ